MTLILMLATFVVLTFLGLSCRRARLDLEEQICDCLHATAPAAVGYGPGPAEIGPRLTGVDGGRVGAGGGGRQGHRHLRVVRAG